MLAIVTFVINISVVGIVRVYCLHCFHCLPVNVHMLNTTELSKRKRSQVHVSTDNDTELSPSFKKKWPHKILLCTK